MATIEPKIFRLKNGRQVILRAITGADALSVNPFFERIAAESTHTMQYVGRELPATAKVAERFESALPEEITLNLGAFDGDQLVGYLNFRPYHAGHPWVRHLAQFGMMILESYWGQGLGRELLRIQDEHARKAGVCRIEAHVRVRNEKGIQLYRRAGFQIEGRRRAEALINGRMEDSYFIAKCFPPAAAETLTRFVLLLSNVEGKRPSEPMIRDHVRFLRQLDQQGSLVLCGPFADGRGGMIVIKAESLDEAKRIAASDPFVAHGFKTAEVRAWELSCEENNHLGMG